MNSQEKEKELLNLNNEVKTTASDSQKFNNLGSLKKDSKAQEMAEYAERAKAAVETVELERDEYRSLFVKANGEILQLKGEVRNLRDQLANKQAQSLRDTTMERERMNVQMQRDANERELDALLDGSFGQLLSKRKN
jgi:hypothetical protein